MLLSSLFLTTTSPLGILTKVQWVNRQWESTLPTTADLIVKLRKDALLESELETLYLENHEYILDMRSFPFQVVLGDSTQLKNKLEKLKIFCAFQTSQDSLIGYDKINLSYKNQVVATTL